MRNRSTETTSLAGKSHRPIHLHIRTPSTRERRAVEMLHTACSALAPRPSSTRPPSDVPFHSPRCRSASHTTLLKDGTREFSGSQETNHAISGAASSVVRLLLKKCPLELCTSQQALSRAVSRCYYHPRDTPNNVHKYHDGNILEQADNMEEPTNIIVCFNKSQNCVCFAARSLI